MSKLCEVIGGTKKNLLSRNYMLDLRRGSATDHQSGSDLCSKSNKPTEVV